VKLDPETIDQAIAAAVEYAREELRDREYGEVYVCFVVHEGRIRLKTGHENSRLYPVVRSDFG